MLARALLPWLVASLAACAAGEGPPRPRNVLLISLDSVRRDALGCYGGRFAGRSASPNLDRLAARGLRFANAYATTSWTLPSHVTLFTGVPELVHGVEQDGLRIDAALPTLAERLASAGYRTAGVYSGPYLDRRFGFDRGFERYRAGYGPELAAAAAELARSAERVHALSAADPPERRSALLASAAAEREVETASHRDSSSRSVTELALEELAATERDGRPFFLFAHYFDAHYDYLPPAPHAQQSDPGYAGAVDGADFVRYLADPPPPLAARDVEHLKALQAGELAWIDAEIGRLLAELERRELAASTLVLVVSDHGDEFLEHGALGHRRTLYEEVLRVPLILHWPGGPRDATSSARVTLADAAASVLALLGVAPGPAPLLAADAERAFLGRLVRSPSGEPADVRVLDSFHWRSLKLLHERSLDPAAPPRLRWIDLALHPEEPDAAWSSDFSSPAARAALDIFRREFERLSGLRRSPPLAEKAIDLLAALRGLGYAGEEARVGALEDGELVRPPPDGATAGER
jgi:arylsulfatase A-like enzyme